MCICLHVSSLEWLHGFQTGVYSKCHMNLILTHADPTCPPLQMKLVSNFIFSEMAHHTRDCYVTKYIQITLRSTTSIWNIFWYGEYLTKIISDYAVWYLIPTVQLSLKSWVSAWSDGYVICNKWTSRPMIYAKL